MTITLTRLMLFVLGIAIVAISPTQVARAAETKEKSLTVGDVIKLLQGGIGEDVVIAKLKKEGKAFDLSTDELIELKKAGASSPVLKTMMDPRTGSTVASSEAKPLSEVDNTFWLYDGDKKILLTQAHVDLTTKMGALAIVTGSAHAFMTLSRSGPTAEIRVKNRNPRFGEVGGRLIFGWPN